MRPVRGAAMVTVALSVITSTIGSSSLMFWPTCACQATISPSVTPSPMSGSLNSKRAMRASSVPGRFHDGGENAMRERQVIHLQRVGKRRIEPGDTHGRRFQMQEGLFVDEGDDLAAEAAGARRFVDHDDAARLLDAGNHGVDIERPQGAKVDH